MNNNDSKKNKKSLSNALVLGLCLFLSAGAITASVLISNKKSLSAYDIAVNNGFNGTEEEWLESLKGDKGDTGSTGSTGAAGSNGTNGTNGETPYIGTNGNWWIGTTDTGVHATGDAGSNGTNGQTPYIGTNGNWWIGTTDTGIAATGAKGDKGDKGDKGETGSTGLTGKTIEEVTAANLNSKLVLVDTNANVTANSRFNSANITNKSLSLLSDNYLYSLKDNKIIVVDDAGYVLLGSDSYSVGSLQLSSTDLYTFTTSDKISLDYSSYLVGGSATILNITKGLDVGELTNTQKVTYANSETAQSVTIRTNNEATILTIDAPLDNVSHYDAAGIVNLLKVAETSYYEFGTVPYIELSAGRIVLEETSDVEIINIAKKDANSYNNPIIADGGVLEENMPDIISRDQVQVTAAGGKTELVQVQKLDSTGSVIGTAEQIYAYANGAVGTTEKTDVQNPDIESTLGLIVLDSDTKAGEKAYGESEKDEKKDEVAGHAVTNELLLNEEIDSNCYFRIGKTGYNTLTAVNTAVTSDCVIYMLKDYYEANGIELLENASAKNIVLDLSGNTLTTKTWLDIHNKDGVSTIRNGSFKGNARIYVEQENVNLKLINVEMERTLGTNNKYIMFSQSGCKFEVTDCNIVGTLTSCEYFIGNFKGGEKIIIEDTTINTGSERWLYNNCDYDEENPSYIEFRGSSATDYNDSNIKLSANYSVSSDDNSVRYTLCANKENWSTHAADSFASLDTANKQLSIGTASELALFANNVNNGINYAGYTVSLSADIDISDYEWLPIGYYDSSDSSVKFAGTFDGNNHKVTGMSIGSGASNAGVGFFGSAASSSKIMNLEVNGNISTSRSYAGGIVGHGYTEITNCKFNGNISGEHSVGGILGSGFGIITDCTVSGNIYGERWVGGIIGNAQESSKAKNCTVTGNITALFCYDFQNSNAGAGAFFGLATRTSTYDEYCTFTGIVKEAGVTKENQYISDYID